MTDEWKARLENVGVVLAIIVLGIVTLILVLTGMDWIETL